MAINLLQKLCNDAKSMPKNSQHYDAVQMALIQSFEIVIELSWKILKEYLEYVWFSEIHNGKTAIRYALKENIVEDGVVLLDAIDLRNITSHTYDFVTTTFIELQTILHKKLKELLCSMD